MKVGVIRCMQTEDMCPGTSDFKAMQNKTGAFESVDGPIEIIGHTSCGGCPGKKAVFKAKMLAGRGADTIAFASCITKGNPIGYACPFHKKWIEIIKKELPEIRYLEYTH